MPTEVIKWNAITALPQVKDFTGKRKAALAQRRKEPFFTEHFDAALAKLAASSFCTGKNERGWKADFDFFLQPDSVVRIMEGKYDDRKGVTMPSKPRIGDMNAGTFNEGKASQAGAEFAKRMKADAEQFQAARQAAIKGELK
jgi:hypothetical protein